MKHALRRWETLIERVDSGLVKLLHVPDACMPADFLTKWTTRKKVRASIDYLINAKNKVYHPNDPNNKDTAEDEDPMAMFKSLWSTPFLPNLLIRSSSSSRRRRWSLCSSSTTRGGRG